jgi:hypothetical protein
VRARNATLRNICPASVSFRLDVGRSDYLAPLLGFVRDELPKVHRREHEFSAANGALDAAPNDVSAWGLNQLADQLTKLQAEGRTN